MKREWDREAEGRGGKAGPVGMATAAWKPSAGEEDTPLRRFLG